MKTIDVMVLALFSFSAASFAREPYVSLSNYVANAQAICIITVERDNGDTTVTVRVDETLKGELDKTEVLRGVTGHCVLSGPVSHFMKPKERYLVFLFDDNTVGRLGGILPIHDQALLARYIDGFTKTIFDKKEYAHKLPLENAIDQIQAILKKETDVQHHPEPYFRLAPEKG